METSETGLRDGRLAAAQAQTEAAAQPPGGLADDGGAVLEWVPTGRLESHPENPRLVLREQVVTDIAGALTRDGFRVEHAILAVSAADGGDGRVVVSGHHRVAAAREAGLTAVPAWVRAMSPQEQSRTLATANDQSELDPVERARHFHQHVQRYGGPGEPGRGQEGGVRQAEREMGYSHVTAVRYHTVGRLVDTLENGQELTISSDGGLLGRMEALHEIAQAPEEAWTPLVGALITEKWRVSDAKNRVRTAREVVDAIPAGHRSWLDPQATVSRWLETGEPTPRAVAGLVAEVERCEETVCEHTPGEVEAFRAWLTERGAALGRLEVMDRRHQVEQVTTRAKPKPTATAKTKAPANPKQPPPKPTTEPGRPADDDPDLPDRQDGEDPAGDTGSETVPTSDSVPTDEDKKSEVDDGDDDDDDDDGVAEEEAGDGEEEEVRARQEEERARATGTDLDLRVCACRDLTVGEPVDAIVCDPPYPEEHLDCYTELAELAARVLRPGGSLLAMCGQSYLPDVLARLTATDGLTYQWTLAYLTPGGQAVQLWQRKVNTFFKPVIWMVAGAYDGPWMSDVARSEVNDNDKRYHHWGQSESGMADLISRVTGPGDLVCDPFLGGGTTGRVALALDRRFVGGDIDPDVVAVTRRRITEARDADPAAAPDAAA